MKPEQNQRWAENTVGEGVYERTWRTVLFRIWQYLITALLCAFRMYIMYVCFTTTPSNRLTLGMSHTLSMLSGRTHVNLTFLHILLPNKL